MSVPLTIILENQFGEVSENQILGGTNPDGTTPIAANTLLGNLTGSTATPAPSTYAAVAAKLPPSMLLTGLAPGAATTILATDTVMEALAKLQAQIDALAP